MYTGRLGTQQDISVDIKSVLLVLGRMIRRNIQCLKIVIILLNLGTFHHLITHTDKDALYFLQSNGVGMPVPDLRLLGGQGHVDHLRFHSGLPNGAFHSAAMLFQHPLDLRAGVIHPLSDLGTLLRRHILHGF